MTGKSMVWVVTAVLCTAPTMMRADAARLTSAATVLTEMAGGGDQQVPVDLIKKARCLVVVPGVKKGAIGVGGQYGRGYLSCRDAGGQWSAPGAVRIEGGSVGFQIGGVEIDVLMAVMNDKGIDRLLSNRFTLGADATVAAGPVGRQASAQTDATMRAEMLAWSHSRGVFAGVALQGQTLREDNDENKSLYGKAMTNREIVNGKIPAPADAKGLMAALGKY